MALEKLWREILPVNVISAGPRLGSLLVQDSTEFRVGMEVILKAVAKSDFVAEIKSINNNIIYFGKPGIQNQAPVDVSDYVHGTMQSPEQIKKAVPEQDQSFDRYERGPTNADRSVLVDRRGEYYTQSNPLDVRISDIKVNADLSVKLTHLDNYPNVGDIADSVRIGDGENEISVNSDGSINTKTNIVSIDGTRSAEVTVDNALKVDGSHVTQPISGDVNATITDISGFNSDAFARLRVSEPFTLGDYKHIYSLNSDLIDKVINGGSVNFVQNKSCATLATSNNPSSYAAHQTKIYHNYQPGKSQMILSSVCFGYAQKNITKRTGYFDDRDGIYFEQVGSNISSGIDNGQLNFVIRSYASGSMSESNVNSYLRRVPQLSWNKDTCNGNGPSGFNINTSKNVLVYIDFQWLGVGRVRCGFVHNGKTIIAHEYYHSNVLSEVYLSNPNLPVRCEIFNTGITSGGSMDQICSTVATEGGYVEAGIDWSVLSGLRTTSTPAATPLPIIAIRLKNSFNGYPNRLLVKPNSFSFFADTNSIQYELVKLPNASSLTGTLNWISASSDSGVEYCVTATGYVSANASVLTSGFVPSGASQNSLSPVNVGNLTSSKRNFICQNIDSNNSEIYAVIIKTINTTGNTSASASIALQWREIY